MRKTYRPMFEVLETRVLLTGGYPLPALPPTTVSVRNVDLPASQVLPGQHVELTRFQMITWGPEQHAQLDRLILLPAAGSAPLQQNINQFELWVDANNNMADGYEAMLATAFADQRGVVDFHIPPTMPWIQGYAWSRMEVVGVANFYLTGSKIGAQVALATFTDLAGNNVPNVLYQGPPSSLFGLKTPSISYSQYGMDAARTVWAGSSIPLIRFGLWANNAYPARMVFVASQGSLDNGDIYTLHHRNYDGVMDRTFLGTITPDGGLIFNIFDSLGHTPNGGTWEVVTRARVDRVGAKIQLAFAPNISLFNGMDPNTGADLEGVVLNGAGIKGGQVQLWTQNATVYTIVAVPGQFAAMLAPDSPAAQYVGGSQTVVAAKYMFSSPTDAIITQATISVGLAASPSIMYASLMDGATVLQSMPVTNGQVNFTGLNVAVSGGAFKTLTVSLTVGEVQTNGVNAKVTLDSVEFLDNAGFGTIPLAIPGSDIFLYGGGMG